MYYADEPKEYDKEVNKTERQYSHPLAVLHFVAEWEGKYVLVLVDITDGDEKQVKAMLKQKAEWLATYGACAKDIPLLQDVTLINVGNVALAVEKSSLLLKA